MTWTQGQPPRVNQSPFIDPTKEPGNPNMKPNDRRNNRNPRAPQGAPRYQQNVDNVAATFTQEGLQTFSTIFSSAVEAAIAKALPDIVERAVERQMRDLLQQAVTDIERITRSLATQIESFAQSSAQSSSHAGAPEVSVVETEHANETSDDTPLPAVSVLSEAPEVDNEIPARPSEVDEQSADAKSDTVDHASESSASTNTQTGRVAQEVELVVHTLREIGRPVKSDELRTLTQDVQWGSNPSVKMSSIINKSNGQIVRVGRGIYQYKA
ncbi:hypothetical protein NZD89_18390 [Alicyclobacillus fastidiosus]|uniref:HTH HARE-type domain-containing protein n=1 Tax=Alicyclobacillus fastidiosus TaxID=392011 RepID=A0ABY6ZDJ9_9BACL|nr:hypothetical protein [Alicyclobacillus fastidiosus]WAH40326.1 hypothetical protein NZD89_18390 [Alicyclobacillus fastidiosus]GMA61709.1 hypothetical protein GCM10025859_21490 [Alicyclobacillus fastidiosus]